MQVVQHPWFAQGIGFVAFAFGIASFLQKDDRRLKLLLTAQCLMLTIHFFLLDAQGGAAMTFIGMVRNGMAATGRNLKRFAWGFIGLFVAAGIIRFEEWVDALPVLSSTLGSYAIFYLKKIPMRVCFFIAGCSWLIHNIVVGSVGPSVMEAVMIAANLRTMLALHRESKAPQQT